MQDLLSASSTRQLGRDGRSNRKWYFEKLLVQVPSHHSPTKPLCPSSDTCKEMQYYTTWSLDYTVRLLRRFSISIEVLHGMRQEIRCNLTLIPRAGMRESAPAVLGRMKMAAALGIQFLDIHNLPLRIHALPLQHAFVSPASLYSIVTRHLIFQVSTPAGTTQASQRVPSRVLQTRVSFFS